MDYSFKLVRLVYAENDDYCIQIIYLVLDSVCLRHIPKNDNVIDVYKITIQISNRYNVCNKTDVTMNFYNYNNIYV